jgi:hypothetical protein
MSKRCIDIQTELTKEGAEVEEIGTHVDIWKEVVFPYFHEEHLSFWLPLQLVSKLWFFIICQSKQHIFTLREHSFDEQYRMLGDRFGGSVKKLKLITHQKIPQFSSFALLQSLNLVYIKAFLWAGKTYITMDLSSLVNLTSLKVGRYICTIGLNKLPNLTDLSIMSVDFCTPLAPFIYCLRTIKRLSLGRLKGGGNGDGHPNHKGLLLTYYPSKSSITYLESDEEELFEDSLYTGKGRLTRSGSQSYYEGEWLLGKKHGKGVFMDDDYKRLEGEWVDGEIKWGTIVHGNSVYEGDVVFRKGNITRNHMFVRAHGKGRLTKGEHSHEGEFKHGVLHGNATLYKNGNPVYSGQWSDGSLVHWMEYNLV